MKTKIITYLLKSLLNVTREQWDHVVEWVEDAAVCYTDGRIKNRWVREQIAHAWPHIKPHVVDALVGVAVAMLKRGAGK